MNTVAPRPASSRAKRRRPGFTLVEMMVALFIFGVLAAAGVTVMGYAVRNQGVVRERMDEIGAFQRMRATLKADLAQATPRRTRGLDGEPATQAFATGAMTGSDALLSFVRRGWENTEGAPRASLQYVEYRLVDGRLERAARPALDGAPVGPGQVLVEGVESLETAYLSRGRWTELWVARPDAQMPEAVRVTMTLRDMGPVTQLFLLPGDPL